MVVMIVKFTPCFRHIRSCWLEVRCDPEMWIPALEDETGHLSTTQVHVIIVIALIIDSTDEAMAL